MNLLNTSSDLLGLPDTEDRVRTARIGADIAFSDTWAGENVLDLHVRKGLGGFGATDEGAGRSRTNGQQDFTSLRASFTRVQPLFGAFSAVLAGEGQYTRDALLASEEFALGGAAFGRAYDAAEITGDVGIAGSLEIRYTGFASPASYQLYGFYDAGTVWNRKRVILDAKRDSLASAGAGVRFGFAHDIEASAEAAMPLTRPVVAEGDEDARVFFRLGKRF